MGFQTKVLVPGIHEIKFWLPAAQDVSTPLHSNAPYVTNMLPPVCVCRVCACARVCVCMRVCMCMQLICACVCNCTTSTAPRLPFIELCILIILIREDKVHLAYEVKMAT